LGHQVEREAQRSAGTPGLLNEARLPVAGGHY
jgi:hypothetical protein